MTGDEAGHRLATDLKESTCGEQDAVAGEQACFRASICSEPAGIGERFDNPGVSEHTLDQGGMLLVAGDKAVESADDARIFAEVWATDWRRGGGESDEV